MACLFDLVSDSKLTSIYFIVHSVITRKPELNIKSIEIFSSSCSAEREAIKHSENSAKLEVDFEPNRGEIVFGIFLPTKAVLAESNYSPFLFLLGPINEQNTSEINFSTCAAYRRLRSIFIGIHS